MGVDGIDKADIFDEYFDDDKPKVTNFEKIKAMDIDDMAEFIFCLDHCSDFDDCANCFIWHNFKSLCKGFEEKQDYTIWLESEVRE